MIDVTKKYTASSFRQNMRDCMYCNKELSDVILPDECPESIYMCLNCGLSIRFQYRNGAVDIAFILGNQQFVVLDQSGVFLWNAGKKMKTLSASPVDIKEFRDIASKYLVLR